MFANTSARIYFLSFLLLSVRRKNLIMLIWPFAKVNGREKSFFGLSAKVYIYEMPKFCDFWIGCVGFWSYSSSGIFQVEVSRLSNMVVLSRFLWNSNHFLFLLPAVNGSCIFRIDFTLDLSWKQAKCIIRSALWNKNLYRKVMFYGLIVVNFEKNLI